jgi:tetratricopeptide (TPR) repeat protein
MVALVFCGVFCIGMGGVVLAQDPEVPEADALLQYAESLGTADEAVAIGAEGLTITGNRLQGGVVIRPAIAMGRAAKLYMEAAAELDNMSLLRKAQRLWRKLDDYRTPVGLYQHYVQTKKVDNPAFADYCAVHLAHCYANQGDYTTAMALLEPYLQSQSDAPEVAMAQAYYASYALAIGDMDTARDVANNVVERWPPVGFGGLLGSAYSMATTVLASLPYLTKVGQTASAGQEAKLLKDAEGNPRLYMKLAHAAKEVGDWQQAITYWEQYRKHLPKENGARSAALFVGDAYVQLKQVDKAIDAYKTTILQYPEYREGWIACLRAVELLTKAKRDKEALALLEQAEKSIQMPQGKAWVLAKHAQLLFQKQMPDEAAEKYIQLLANYGDQDAVKVMLKDSMRELQMMIPKVKRWKVFAQTVQTELGKRHKKQGVAGKAEAINIPLADASNLRRLVLNFYIENDNLPGGLSWLKALGMNSDEKERNWYIRDEAWLDAQTTFRARIKYRSTKGLEFTNWLKLGITAWKIAPFTEEGLYGLKSTQQFILERPDDKPNLRYVVRELEAARGGDFDAEIAALLVPLYETLTDQKSRKALQDGAL